MIYISDSSAGRVEEEERGGWEKRKGERGEGFGFTIEQVRYRVIIVQIGRVNLTERRLLRHNYKMCSKQLTRSARVAERQLRENLFRGYGQTSPPATGGSIFQSRNCASNVDQSVQKRIRGNSNYCSRFDHLWFVADSLHAHSSR